MHFIRAILMSACLMCGGLLPWVPARALVSDPFGQLFTSNSGLSNTEITAVLQDSLGFLWIGTRGGGLNKYDGYSFEQFRYQPDTVSLSSNKVRCLVEGREGVLWVGTDYGLNKLDRHRGNLWTHYPPEAVESSGAGHQIIYSLYLDKEGKVWMRTGQHIVLLDPDTGELTRIPLYLDESTPWGRELSYSMWRDSKGFLWMGTKDGLQILDPVTGKIYLHQSFRKNGPNGHRVRRILEDVQGRIWCGTEKGLFLYDPDKDVFGNAGELLPELGSLEVLSLEGDRNGNLLVGTSASLVRVSSDLSRAESFSGFNRSQVYTQLRNVNAICPDRSRILWIGTSEGLVKIDQKSPKFQLINKLSPGWENLSSNAITSVYQDGNGDIWLGTDGMGLNYYPRGTESPILYRAHAPSISRRLVHDQVHDITRDRGGNLWVGTGNGISVMRAGFRRFYSFHKIFNGQHVYDVFEDSKGFLWFAASNGIHKYDPADRSILSIKRIHIGSEVIDLQDVYCVTEDLSGRIWIGSSVGLIKYNPTTDDYEVFQAGILQRHSNINSNVVQSLHVDEKGNLWVGTASGLNRYLPEENSFEYISDPVELSELKICGILSDGKGNLWLSSDRGLAVYRPELETFIRYGTADGLQGEEFQPGSSYRNRYGRMYFGGNSGLNTFHPDSIVYNPFPPPLSFTQFVRFREQGGMSRPLALDMVSTVIVPRGVEVVTIRFSALEFTYPERNRYLYKMVRKGQDGLWIHNGEQHYVTFNRLNPGTYTLSVKGSNNDLLYSEDAIDLEIIVPYPFWNKTLAIGLYILAGCLVFLLILQLRTRKLRKSNRILRQKEMSAKEIERQRADLARKNKNITDSIIYAKRIQHALLPSDESFRNLLPESFVYFKPKDIVSGDFYWINQHGKKIYVAAVDCTGHGVPGAFMSIIGFELFRKITTSEQGSNPAMILDTLNENFSDIFSDGEQVYLNDGMDLSLCIIDREENSLDYSGAFNPLYLVRNETIIEVKADRFSVGADVHFSAERKLFKSHKIYLQKDDIIYMFSDGFADQFGGPEGKKFKYRRFRHLLLTIHKLPMEKQRSFLEASFEEWQGDIDQVDDILVIGIRP